MITRSIASAGVSCRKGNTAFNNSRTLAVDSAGNLFELLSGSATARLAPSDVDTGYTEKAMLLGIDLGQTTGDGRFTMVEVECIAGCDRAPSMMIDDTYHEPMDEKKLDALLDKLSADA